MMKFLIIIILLFILIAVSFLVFILTFDVNQYRPLLTEKIEELIGKDVRLGEMSLSFLPGLAIRIDEFSVKDKGKSWQNSLLKAKSIEARIKLLPLIKKDIIIHRLSGLIAGGSFFVKGAIEDVFSSRYSDFDISLEEVNLASFLPGTAPGKPYFEGRIDLDITCSTRGLNTKEIIDTLSARGNLRLDKAVLKNMNILRVALQKLNMLPGLVEDLKERLPERYSELLKQSHTAFKPVEADFNMEDGKLFFQKIIIESDAFYLVSDGYLSMVGDINIRSDLFIPRDLSDAFIEIAPQLKYLQNARGMITMPLEVKGLFPEISVKPDLDYAIRKLLISKGRELLEGIFKKEVPEETEEKTGTRKKQEEVEPAEVLIRTIFDLISAPQDTKRE